MQDMLFSATRRNRAWVESRAILFLKERKRQFGEGIISIDFSKGAMFVEWGGLEASGLSRADSEVPSGGSQQTPLSCSGRWCFIGEGAGRS
ncbi:hypothetical protein FQN60_010191 [Etheostoma spectabile]|uniref:Uncharacterized protein n=1 Tax=Etheostoma spectabile TaxID=54343 RepID=A0A5J5D881_9PERO|nr:hypothetical protein FQN60_010191 [Etheostoma spectabile]